MLWTKACWEKTICWISRVMRGRVEVSMGDSGRDEIPRECCGGGEGELNAFTEREGEGQKQTGETETAEIHAEDKDFHPNLVMTNATYEREFYAL